MYYELSETEKSLLDKWLRKREVKRALKAGASFSLTFNISCGIGRTVKAELDAGKEPEQMAVYPPLVCDITDYNAW